MALRPGGGFSFWEILVKYSLLSILTMTGLLLMICISAAYPQAALPKMQGTPDEGYSSNAATDVIRHDGGIWLVTGEGVLFTYDDGLTWASYNASNGLVSDIASALYSNGSRLWVGTSHSEVIDGYKFSISDGVSYSDDDGFTWEQIDFSSSGQNISNVYGGYRTVYDITGHEDWVFFASFASGLLSSNDNGLNWRRIFPTAEDSAQYVTSSQPTENNRYFSAAADSSHGDTLMVWTGTAGGLYQYVYAPITEKLSSRYVSHVSFCPDCVDSVFFYVGGENGITRGLEDGAPFISRFESDGLPGPSVTAIYQYGGRLFVGTEDERDGNSTGLAVSDDFGDTYWPVTGFNTGYAGGDNHVRELANMEDRLYMAASDAGLFVSYDVGDNWERILVDSSDEYSIRNTVNAVTAYGDTLFVGTDTGLAKLYMTPAGDIDSTEYMPFPEGDSSCTRVIGVRIQEFTHIDSSGTEDVLVYDSVAYWTINRPLTALGRPMVGRKTALGTEWQNLQVGVRTNDVAFWSDTAFAVGEAGARFTTSGGNPSTIYRIIDVRNSTRVDSLTQETLYSMKVSGDTIIVGSSNGYGISTDRGDNYRVYRPNLDDLKADVVVAHTSINAWQKLLGDFIPAIDVQYFDDGRLARIWVSNRSTSYWPDTNAITVGYVVPIDDNGDEIDEDNPADTVGYAHRWKLSLRDEFAWNYAFKGDSVFAATNDGLLFRANDETAWDTIPLRDENGEDLVVEGTAVYGVEVDGDYLWVTTSDRTVRINLSSGNFTDQKPYYVIDSAAADDEVYAFPVPFSHANDNYVDFHFAVPEAGNVTLEIYDFAMNLVRRVIDGRFYAAGIYPTFGSDRVTWDGLNGLGDEVAVGVYYFKVTLPGGESHWGKLAVIP